MAVNREFTAALRLFFALFTVALVTWIDFSLAHVNSPTAAFTYLLLILGLATQIGRAESVAASLASMLAYDFFFLPPLGTLTLADPQNWITLLSFVVTAVITSHLSSTVRTRADQAAAGQRQIQRMYDFSHGLMLSEESGLVAERAAHQLVAALGATASAVFISQTKTIATAGDPSPFTEPLMQRVSATGEPWFGELRAHGEFKASNEPQTASVVPIRFGGHPLGSLAVAGAKGISEVALYAVTQLVGAEIERAQAQETAARMYAARESEHLKSVLLDALAHEFKTPLTSIKAAATSLLSQRKLTNSDHEMAAVINEEADRLTTLVSDAIQLARVGSGAVQLQPEPCAPEELIRLATTSFKPRLEDRDVHVLCDSGLPAVTADPKLTEIALRQLLSNAVLYSPDSTPISIQAMRNAGAVILSVGNQGPPIPPAEQTRLFEKFYRGENARGRIAGSGMGLAIARDIVLAHGGKIWIENEPTGVRFLFSLPLAASS